VEKEAIKIQQKSKISIFIGILSVIKYEIILSKTKTKPKKRLLGSKNCFRPTQFLTNDSDYSSGFISCLVFENFFSRMVNSYFINRFNFELGGF